MRSDDDGDGDELMQVWGYWGSVPTDIPALHPLILGFNEPDHENQVKIVNQQTMTSSDRPI